MIGFSTTDIQYLYCVWMQSHLGKELTPVHTGSSGGSTLDWRTPWTVTANVDACSKISGFL